MHGRLTCPPFWSSHKLALCGLSEILKVAFSSDQVIRHISIGTTTVSTVHRAICVCPNGQLTFAPKTERACQELWAVSAKIITSPSHLSAQVAEGDQNEDAALDSRWS